MVQLQLILLFTSQMIVVSLSKPSHDFLIDAEEPYDWNLDDLEVETFDQNTSPVSHDHIRHDRSLREDDFNPVNRMYDGSKYMEQKLANNHKTRESLRVKRQYPYGESFNDQQNVEEFWIWLRNYKIKQSLDANDYNGGYEDKMNQGYHYAKKADRLDHGFNNNNNHGYKTGRTEQKPVNYFSDLKNKKNNKSQFKHRTEKKDENHEDYYDEQENDSGEVDIKNRRMMGVIVPMAELAIKMADLDLGLGLAEKAKKKYADEMEKKKNEEQLRALHFAKEEASIKAFNNQANLDYLKMEALKKGKVIS